MNKQLEDRLRIVIDDARNYLYFQPILKEGLGNEDEYYEEGESFLNNKGELLRGRVVLYCGEFYDYTIDGDVDFSTEVFLTDQGKLQKFLTLRESQFCHECQQTHTHLHRMVAKDQALDDDYLDAIMNNISVELRLAN